MLILFQDLRYAARMLIRNPAFTAIAVMTLGLGIGANTAIFSIVNAVLLRPLPYKDADSLVRIVHDNARAGALEDRRVTAINQEHFLQWRERTRTLSHLSVFDRYTKMLTARAESTRLAGAAVSPALLPMLGASPEIGRGFDDGDERPGARTVVMLSDEMWERYFGRDPGIVGRTVSLDGRAHTIVGVMPASFEFPDKETLFWMPFVITPPAQVPGGGEIIMVQAIGRLKDGVSLEQAAAEANTPAVIAGLEGRIEVLRLKDELVAPFRPALTILLESVGFVLLIACANVANLLLSRAASRQQEILVRSFLGASRGRLVRQVLTESLLLAALGGAAGVVLSYWGIPIVAALDPGTIPRLKETRLDTPVFLFSIAVSLVTGVCFGLAPALHMSRPDRAMALRGTRVRNLLTAAEVALAMMLLVGAGVLIKGFIKVSNVSRGFNPENALTFELALPEARYPAARWRQFLEQFLEELRAEPGVGAAAVSDSLPAQAAHISSITISVDPDSRRRITERMDIRIVSADFFKATGMTLADGRTFNDGDRAGQAFVVVINKTLARQRFGNENPIGQSVRGVLDDAGPGRVIGVVEDVKPAGIDARVRAEVYVNFRQVPPQLHPTPVLFTLRMTSDPAAVMGRARTHVKQFDSQLVVENVATMSQRMSDTVAQPRFYAAMLGTLAFVALALAAAGLYGVMSYAVSQRAREIGIRMALGAARGDVIGLVAAQGMVFTGAGIAAGLGGALALTRYLESMLFGVSPFDPATVVGVSMLLAAVAALAIYIPARRATRVDPVAALRCE